MGGRLVQHSLLFWHSRAKLLMQLIAMEDRMNLVLIFFLADEESARPRGSSPCIPYHDHAVVLDTKGEVIRSRRTKQKKISYS